MALQKWCKNAYFANNISLISFVLQCGVGVLDVKYLSLDK